MIVHIISRLNVGGTSVWIRNLVSECERRGQRSIVIAGDVYDELADSLYSENYVNTLKYWGKKSSLIQNIRAFLEIRRLLKTNSPTIVNTHTAKAGFLGRLVVLSLGRGKPKLVHTIHGHYLYGYKKPILSLFWLINEALLGMFTETIICVGTNVKKELIRTGLFSSTKLLVIYPGISLTTKKRKEKGENRETHNDSFTVGWMGRLEPVKQPESLIGIAKLLPNIQFVMVGSGTLFDIIWHSLPPNIKYLSYCLPDEMWPNVNLAVSTSRNEGIPTALIEATLYGVPCVAPDVGSIFDVVEDGINGILVSRSTDELLAHAISIVAANKDLYHSLKQGCAEVAKRFSVDAFYHSHENAYR